jgi:hypothetical protein
MDEATNQVAGRDGVHLHCGREALFPDMQFSPLDCGPGLPRRLDAPHRSPQQTEFVWRVCMGVQVA